MMTTITTNTTTSRTFPKSCVAVFICLLSTSAIWPAVPPFATAFSVAPSRVVRVINNNNKNNNIQYDRQSSYMPPLQVSTTSSSASQSEAEDNYAGSLVSGKGQSHVSVSQLQPAKKITKGTKQQLPWDWKGVVQEVWKIDMRPIIMFDGDCNLCNGGVNMLLDMDTANKFRFCSLSSKFGQSLLVAHGKDPDDRNSIMVIFPSTKEKPTNNNGKKVVSSNFLQKSEAVMEIATNLAGAPAWIKAMTSVGTVAPVAVSDWLLQIIADNRYRVAGEYDQCRLDLDGEYDGRFLNDCEHEDLFVPVAKKMDDDNFKDSLTKRYYF